MLLLKIKKFSAEPYRTLNWIEHIAKSPKLKLDPVKPDPIVGDEFPGAEQEPHLKKVVSLASFPKRGALRDE